jgi:acetyl esterase/lipase
VVAFASIDYRLSRHPKFPQDPGTTSATQLRAAAHPGHLHDVQTAIDFLQEKYGFAERYILVGHSCGATLAYQTVMAHVAGAESTALRDIAKPRCIAGVAGIYDLRLLRDDYKHIPAYQEFLEEAFGPDEALWDGVSPARASSETGGGGWCWAEGKLAVLAHSPNDELVNMSQALAMQDALTRWKGITKEGGGTQHIILLKDLKQSHYGVWRDGKEMAEVIAIAIQELAKADSCA